MDLDKLCLAWKIYKWTTIASTSPPMLLKPFHLHLHLPRPQEKPHCHKSETRTQTYGSSQTNYSKQTQNHPTARWINSPKRTVQDSPRQIILKQCQLRPPQHSRMHQRSLWTNPIQEKISMGVQCLRRWSTCQSDSLKTRSVLQLQCWWYKARSTRQLLFRGLSC